MATALKARGYDALAAGTETNRGGTLELLCDWADQIILATEVLRQYIPEKHKERCIALDIDVDKWGQANVPYLKRLVKELLDQKGFMGDQQ